jgi:hypothetical protein
MIFLLPVFMLGADYAGLFWQESWYIAVIFICIIGFINILYFSNRKTLACLESENWPELKLILEDKIFIRKHLRKTNVRMYISTCIASSSISDIGRLESLLKTENPGNLDYWALQLGLPHLLCNDPADMKEYFGTFIDRNAREKGWIKWNYCFALLLLKENDEAVEILKSLAADASDSILRLASLYMLDPFKSEEGVRGVVEQGRAELRMKMPEVSLQSELDKRKDNVQMLFLTQIISKASSWLYKDENEKV